MTAHPTHLPPGPVTDRGRAPGLRFRLLASEESRRTYVLAFGKGDEAASGLVEFAEAQKLQGARFTGIGAFERARLAWFDRQKKSYRLIPVLEAVEVVSLIGNIAIERGKPIVHVHCAFGREDGSMVGGHLLEGIVFPTLEIHLSETPPIPKKHDPETDLELMDL